MRPTIFLSILLIAAVIAAVTFTQTGRNAAYGLWTRAGGIVTNNTVLLRAEGSIAAAKASRDKLHEISERFIREAFVTDRHIERLEGEMLKSKTVFENLQIDAKLGGLPKFEAATDEEKNAEYIIAGKRMPGSEAYRLLRKHKTELRNGDAAIKRETILSHHYKKRSEELRDRIPSLDDKIHELSILVEDYKIAAELQQIEDSVKNIGISASAMDETLDGNGTVEGLRQAIDRANSELDHATRVRESEEIMRVIMERTSPFQVTDDDLI